MLHIQTSGTLGDAWVTALKLCSLSEPVVAHHTIEGPHAYWEEAVCSILLLAPNVQDVIFSPEVDPDLPRVRSQCSTQLDDVPGIETKFYARLLDPVEIDRSDVPVPPYAVVQCHAGKPPGKGVNTKLLSFSLISHVIGRSALPVVLIGTLEEYKGIESPYNRVGQWDLLKTMRVVSEANGIVSPDGLMAYVAASYRLRVLSYFGDQGAIEGYINGTPWGRHFVIHFVPSGEFCQRGDGLAASIDGPLLL